MVCDREHCSVPRPQFILLPMRDRRRRDVVVQFRDEPHELLLRQFGVRDGDAHAFAAVLEQLGLLAGFGGLGSGQGDYATDALNGLRNMSVSQLNVYARAVGKFGI